MRLLTMALAGALAMAGTTWADEEGVKPTTPAPTPVPTTPAPTEPEKKEPAAPEGEKKPEGEQRGPRSGRERPPTRTAEEILKRSDKDGDGCVSKEEFLKDGYEQMKANPNFARRMGDLDKNGNNEIEFDEYCASPMAGERFARLDTNSDGKLDKAEVDAMAKQQGQRGGRGGQGQGQGRRGQGQGQPQPQPPQGGEKKDDGTKAF